MGWLTGRTVTLGDLRRSGQLLEIGCTACNHHDFFSARTLPYKDNFEVPILARVWPCPSCNAYNTATSAPVWIRPDSRPPKMGVSA